MDDNSSRDRIRALVRDVLDKAMPEVEGSGVTTQPPSRFIDVTPKTPAVISTETDATRDESSKSMITEDDVRGLADGATLRIAEGARLTPLAADLVSEKKIEIVRRVPRRGTQASRMLAIGADHGGYKMKEDLKKYLAGDGPSGPRLRHAFPGCC